MRSPTQRALNPENLLGYAREALGPGMVIRSAAELTGGGFAAVWRLTLDDGRQLVLKVGPPAGTRLLGYETGLIAAEAAYFRLVRDRVPAVPVPDVLHCGDDWLLTSYLPGRTLAEWGAGSAPPDDAPARSALGAAVAAVHTITGPRFGYLGPRPAGATWPDAFAAMIDDLLRDAAAWDVTLPVDPANIRELVNRRQRLLAAVTRPALLHFDLWDGNVLATVDADGRAQLSGIVDGERHLYGDPLLDLVSPALFRRIEDEPDHPFLRGYAAVDFDRPTRVRLALYRVHLYLLMLVEAPSRGLAADGARRRMVEPLLVGALADAEA